jgi:hypothetical protein
MGPWSPIQRFVTTGVTPPPALTAPTLIAPAFGDSAQSLTPTLSWTGVVNANSYGLVVALDSLFTAPVATFDSLPASPTNRTVGPLSANTTYHWRVRAKNVQSAGPYSSPRRFRTGN